ncbi:MULTISPECIES: tagaturonate reductase [Bacteroidales]|jgi:tagaturonate reductase|uniref:Altronate oxidoreductase n=1 Tax=Coprobacter secundus subsp. similis TaxID=2751153 RepID=A0A7G1HVJ9_9BACT|nr:MULTISPECIES: tagaturonate reductase [Bacteroidales]BCI63053.1 altronate oxidoreductase [Coprobacter secundus subsp. similis]
MKTLNRNTIKTNRYPERIIQFGEGNFLRAFVDWIIYNMNQKANFNSSVVVVQPLEKGMINVLNEQDGLYHVNLQGLENGKAVDNIQLIDVISRGINPYTQYNEYIKLAENPETRFIISNTTEAGITFDPQCKLEDIPAKSYPGKLTQLLYHRFKTFNGAPDKGFIIFPCELIFNNGHELKKCIEQYIELWNLGHEFKKWFDTACSIYCTLVDRIVPGYPKDSINEILEHIQLEDKLVVKGEIFHLWVIEAPQSVSKEFPADKAGLNVLFVPSEKPYHDRKVTLLNGPHTVLSPIGYLSGLNTVKECCESPVIGRYVKKVMYDELLQTLDLPQEELIQFADAVMERFRNPFVKHFVTSIMLNSFPKFKTRDLPGLKKYLERKGELPSGLVLGLAGIIVYYKGGKRGNDEIIPNDDPAIIELLSKLWAENNMENLAKGVLGATFIWEEDLNLIPGLSKKLCGYLQMIQDKGMEETVKSIL